MHGFIVCLGQMGEGSQQPGQLLVSGGHGCDPGTLSGRRLRVRVDGGGGGRAHKDVHGSSTQAVGLYRGICMGRGHETVRG